jgi:hypothetical protein
MATQMVEDQGMIAALLGGLALVSVGCWSIVTARSLRAMADRFYQRKPHVYRRLPDAAFFKGRPRAHLASIRISGALAVLMGMALLFFFVLANIKSLHQ